MRLIKVGILVLLLSVFSLANEKININFKDLKIMDLVKITSKIIDKNILVTQDIKGNVDFISNKPVSKDELIKILIYVLEEKGFTLVTNDNMLRIVKLNESVKSNVPVVTSKQKHNYNQIVTEIFRVNSSNVDYIASKIRHLTSRDAKLVANKEANTIVLTDFMDNIQTVKKVVQIMTFGSQKSMEVIELNNVQADEAKKNLDAISKAIFNQTVEIEKVDIVANKENNSLVLIGKKSNIKYLKNYIIKMDSKESLIKRVVEVYPLKNVEAKNVTKIIEDIIGKKKYLDQNDKPLSSVDEETNSIVLMGPSDEVDYIKVILDQLDKEKPQVYVEAKIIELNDSLVSQIGVQYGIFGASAGSDGLASFASSLNNGSAIVGSDLIDKIGLEIPDISEGLALGASISLLNEDGALDIVSEPSILAINNKESSIYVGETISIKTSQTTTDGGNTNENYQREDVGLTLKVKPRVSNDNKVTLEINTILEDVKTTETSSGNADTSKKEVETTAIVNNGESVIIGGLIQDKEESTENKVPLLGDIPLLGELFKHDKTDYSKKNLVIIVTPYIVPKSKDLSYVRNQLAGLKALEDRYLKKSLIRLKKKKIEKMKEEEKYKEQMDELDEELNSMKKTSSSKSANKKLVNKYFGN
ncbi:secretin N-terminal domain-containing protein [Halarcobacter sp.]|uniref:secretin N-terminal domain-containing protein n=1 Tax=Halarcobacter sp. TaxID=2321133 RepID=UPI002AAAB3F4|nr:secretin N-terminal domain-containing protein [Halarcobacter sp.]